MMHIELLKPHTHAGTLLEPGDVIDLPADLARWLCASGIAKAHPAPASAKPISKTEESQ
jgi:hypothetical protein